MSSTCPLCCVVRKNVSHDVPLNCEPNEWETLSWIDEYGNSIAPFFTSLEAGQPFLRQMNDWQLKQYPISFVVEVILADIKQETSFYTIDPVSTMTFETLSPAQFLTELICHKYPADIEMQEHAAENDIVPIEDFFTEGCDPQTEDESRRLLGVADLIFGIDVPSGRQSIVFGRLSLEELLRTGQSNVLAILNVGLHQATLEIEQLVTLVQDIKGHHDYHEGVTVR